MLSSDPIFLSFLAVALCVSGGMIVQALPWTQKEIAADEAALRALYVRIRGR